MRSIKGISRLALYGLCLWLAACGGKQEKQIQEEPQQVVREFDFSAAQKRPIRASEFGPNPYLAAAVTVPEEAMTQYRFAVEALKGGNQDLAEQQLLEMLDSYPALSGPAYNLAVLKRQQGDQEAAEKYLEMALNRNYANFDARNLKALMLREAGEFDQAEQVYRDIISSWGGYAPAYRNLGILYDIFMGRVDDALVYYRQYNYMIDEPDPQVNGWIVDIERRYGIPPLSFDEPEPEASGSAVDQAGGDAESSAAERDEPPVDETLEADQEQP